MLVCPICNNFADSLTHLKHHISSAHDANIIKSFTCKQGPTPCQRTYSSLKSLYRHITYQHCQPSFHTFNNDCPREQDISDESFESIPLGDEDTPVNLDFDVNELTFILSLYAEPNLNRANVEKICSAVNNLVHRKFGVKGSLFKNLDTEYKVNLARDKLDIRLESKSFIVDYSPSISKCDDTQDITMKKTCAVKTSETVMRGAYKWIKFLGYKYEQGSICVLKDFPSERFIPRFC